MQVTVGPSSFINTPGATVPPRTGHGKMGRLDGYIAFVVGKVINKFKVGKHFRVSIEEDSFSYHRKEGNIAREEALDGIYVIRTSLSSENLTSEASGHSL